MKFYVFDAYGFRQKDIEAPDYATALKIAKRTIHAPMLESYDDYQIRKTQKELRKNEQE